MITTVLAFNVANAPFKRLNARKSHSGAGLLYVRGPLWPNLLDENGRTTYWWCARPVLLVVAYWFTGGRC
ncbi:hypothetical protein GCM10009740_02890 [Terrabacter terrae]|uniref:Uncharacterized protein n=1 Tax=Terrabacter terrae TaxID=318434 RepID=A0ABN2TS26_9MICO